MKRLNKALLIFGIVVTVLMTLLIIYSEYSQSISKQYNEIIWSKLNEQGLYNRQEDLQKADSMRYERDFYIFENSRWHDAGLKESLKWKITPDTCSHMNWFNR